MGIEWGVYQLALSPCSHHRELRQTSSKIKRNWDRYCATDSPQGRSCDCCNLCLRWTRSLQWAGGGTIVQRTCMINLAKVLKSWTSHMKRIVFPLEQSKSSCTITAARIKNKGKFIIGAKEETRWFRNCSNKCCYPYPELVLIQTMMMTSGCTNRC